MKTVLFVCTQNIFRSASAEFLLKKLLAEHNDTSFTVLSAGTKGNDPYGMYPMTKERIELYGGDPSSHHQKKLTQDLVDRAQIIICMTNAHKNFVQSHFNTTSYLFNELAKDEMTDLEDDDEAAGTYDNLTDFVYHTVDTIYQGMPELYHKLQKMNL